MASRKKVYLVINHNAEGYNFLGVYDTERAANEACDKYNTREKMDLRRLFANDSEKEMKSHLDFYDWWESAKVVEYEMNSMRY